VIRKNRISHITKLSNLVLYTEDCFHNFILYRMFRKTMLFFFNPIFDPKKFKFCGIHLTDIYNDLAIFYKFYQLLFCWKCYQLLNFLAQCDPLKNHFVVIFFSMVCRKRIPCIIQLANLDLNTEEFYYTFNLYRMFPDNRVNIF
jgi:hypothetical protein